MRSQPSSLATRTMVFAGSRTSSRSSCPASNTRNWGVDPGVDLEREPMTSPPAIVVGIATAAGLYQLNRPLPAENAKQQGSNAGRTTGLAPWPRRRIRSRRDLRWGGSLSSLGLRGSGSDVGFGPDD